MAIVKTPKSQLKKEVRKVLLDLLKEDRTILHGVLADVVEDWMFGQIIERERNAPKASRETLFKILKGRK
jgi:hypothetical protein